MRSLWAPAALVALIGAAVRVGMLATVAAVQDDKLWGLLNKWDAKHYVEIARGGYFGADISTDGPVHETTMAFFPGFPFLVRAISGILGTGEAGTAIALNVLFSIALA
ncbi:MAG: mannosyltransferase family protein, partial [Corynebacterium sp.]|nr:mannosyltransferase family protein [Corynebacterium sp.]